MTAYTDTIRRYAADDRRVGRIEDADGLGEVGLAGPEAGSRLAVRFTLTLTDGIIARLRYQVFGCGYTIAACAAAAELNEGKVLAAAGSSPATINQVLGGLPVERDYCAELASRALQAALDSALDSGRPVQADLAPSPKEDHGSRIRLNDPFYNSLLETPCESDIPETDRRLFAGLLTVASQESTALADMLGLEDQDLQDILCTYFPEANFAAPPHATPEQPLTAPEVNLDVQAILRSHLSERSEAAALQPAEWLTRILAARAVRPGHLWISMGLRERPELSAAIRRHLPSLATANHQNMRWKRFLFKQACELNGSVMCKSPNCGDCSDYALCFVDEE